MNRIPIEIVTIGFDDLNSLRIAISFINENQNFFSFSTVSEDRFLYYQPSNELWYRTKEIYCLIDDVLKDLKGFHNLVIGIVNKRLDGSKLGNLFGSMETNERERLTGKAIISTYGIDNIIGKIPLSIYYCFELLSFSIRFIVGKGMIHNGERGCLFHNKINKIDIVETMQSGYISLDSLKTIHKYLDFEQIQYIQSMLIKLSYVSRADNPELELRNILKNNNFMSLLKTSVFISYSHKDSQWLERLQINLKPLERKGVISAWDDTKIKPSMIWKEEIIKALSSARVAILLVSADFLASDFIMDMELPSLLNSAKNNGTLILPIILKPCLFDDSEIGQYQSINPPTNPIIGMSELERENIFVKTAKIINETIC